MCALMSAKLPNAAPAHVCQLLLLLLLLVLW
jgi:hypothetical protein